MCNRTPKIGRVQIVPQAVSVRCAKLTQPRCARNTPAARSASGCWLHVAKHVQVRWPGSTCCHKGYYLSYVPQGSLLLHPFLLNAKYTIALTTLWSRRLMQNLCQASVAFCFYPECGRLAILMGHRDESGSGDRENRSICSVPGVLSW